VVTIDNQIRTMIHNRVAEAEIEKYARTQGPDIRTDGLRKILSGLTTVEEVLRVTRENQ
jgi:general secretion pathway protein E